ncbi:MAG: reductive dehalogenase domain-containing protein [Pseudomonadota bacterium]
MKLFSGSRRPVALGPYPAERLKRLDDSPYITAELPVPAPSTFDGPLQAVESAYAPFPDEPIAPRSPALTADPGARAALLKSAAFFYDAAAVGCCATANGHALVVLSENPGTCATGTLAAHWTLGAEQRLLNLRAREIATVLATYLRKLGYASNLITDRHQLADLGVRSGVLLQRANRLENPFIGTSFGIVAITAELELAVDRPLDPNAGSALAQAGWHWLVGIGGCRSLLERWRSRQRPDHTSRYPMERLRRVTQPTTVIHADEVPRVAMRANFFTRAGHGDLGPKARGQMPNFVDKEPLGASTRAQQAALLPLQEGTPSHPRDAITERAWRSDRSDAVKSLGYWLGADLVGMCEVPSYAWYSHDDAGEPIRTRHRYAIVLLLDQGFDTMEGGSGDDWISGSQSMRAYLRGMEIAVLLAAHLRKLGYPAKAHSNAYGEVLQLPLLLQAGLGELSRIGEVVLNPFVGPRFKSAVVTTDMPLAVDQPIDFGLQDVCRKCRKCARECPCNAISWDDPVMFNGYEMWKPDVERCTRYRLTNARGAACGRCMKTCPFNHEGLPIQRLALRAAIRLPALRGPIARLDDRLRRGRRNPVKKWWADLEMIDGRADTPPAGVNARDLSLDKTKPTSPIAYYNAADNPPADAESAVAVDRSAALKAVQLLETPAEAVARRARGEPPPAHYRAPDP